MELLPISLSDIKSLPQSLSVIEDLLVSMTQSQERIDALEDENKHHEDELNMDSHNRSLTPSADKGRQQKSTRSLRQKGVREYTKARR